MSWLRREARLVSCRNTKDTWMEDLEDELNGQAWGIKTEIDTCNMYPMSVKNVEAKESYLLACKYLLGYEMEENHTRFFLWCRKAAGLGDAKAQFLLGLVYGAGYGGYICNGGIRLFESDEFVSHAQVVSWFQRSAEDGNPSAQYCLGLAYEKGKGVIPDELESFKWYCAAAKRNHREAFRRIRFAAYNGNAIAQFCLGVCLQYGACGRKSERQAVKWYKKAASQGCIMAQQSLDSVKEKKE
jgi:hypothetical protein